MGVPTMLSFAFALLAGSCLAEEALNPSNGVEALDAVELALHNMLSSPNTTSAMIKMAKPVVAVVEQTVKDVESGSNLTAKAKSEKVLVAIKALQGLQGQMQTVSVRAAKEQKLDGLKRKLAMKQAELSDDVAKIKLAKMQKELVEKEQELEVLKEKKEQASAKGKDDVAQKVAIAGLLNQANAVKKNTTDAPKAMQAILANLKAQVHTVSESIDRMDADEKKREDQLLPKAVPTMGKDDAINKAQGVLKMILKQARHSYKKARAVKQAQLSELNEGVHSIESGDVGALQKLMVKMQGELKSANSKSKDFLH